MKIRISRLAPFGLMIEGGGLDPRELNLSTLREYFHEENFLVLRGFRSFSDAEIFSAWCEGFGKISVWPFGKVLELKERNNPEDHIFDNNYVPLHWDGMYRPKVPEFQIFQCVEAPAKGQGGRTTFSHTPIALKSVPAATRKLWDKITGSYQRKMEFYDSKTIAPLVGKHPVRGYEVIRYNEPPSAGRRGMKEFVNPPLLEFSGAGEREIAEAHRSLREALYGPAAFYAHEWQPGDILINDNYTLLHGREAFESKAPRHLRRVHVLGSPPLVNPHLVSHR